MDGVGRMEARLQSELRLKMTIESRQKGEDLFADLYMQDCVYSVEK